jgi:hypothetical protein
LAKYQYHIFSLSSGRITEKIPAIALIEALSVGEAIYSGFWLNDSKNRGPKRIASSWLSMVQCYPYAEDMWKMSASFSVTGAAEMF